MAITDIPELVKAVPGDLIRSDDVNNVQRLARNSVRTHRHTRATGAPVDDTASTDLALQLATDEIADLAVTDAKLAAAAVSAAKLADGAVGNAKLANAAVTTISIQDGAISNRTLAANAVARASIQDDAINRAKLSLQEVASGSTFLAANGSSSGIVLLNFNNAANTILIPTVALTSIEGGAFAEVQASIFYRRLTPGGGSTVDVFLRLRNTGPAAAVAFFRVFTFAAPPYPTGLLAGIGGQLV
jgi:hypothetical protein